MAGFMFTEGRREDEVRPNEGRGEAQKGNGFGLREENECLGEENKRPNLLKKGRSNQGKVISSKSAGREKKKPSAVDVMEHFFFHEGTELVLTRGKFCGYQSRRTRNWKKNRSREKDNGVLIQEGENCLF